MSNIQRIKSLMMISEQEQRPVTSPVDIKGLVLLLQYINKNEPKLIEDLENADFYDSIFFENNLKKIIDKNAKLFGLPNKINGDEFDFITAFILQNKNKILEGIQDSSEYIIPKQKTFLITGEEIYSGRKSDVFELKEIAYNKEYLEELITNHEILISDGKFIREEWGDTWDVEQKVLDIEEISPENESINEEIDLDSFKAPFTSEDFVNYVNSEFDLEMLEIMQNIIQKRINLLKGMVNIGKRKEVKGFRKFD